MKVKTIRIYHDKKMFWSDWIIFVMGALIILTFMKSMVNVINTIHPDSSRMIALIVLMMVFLKVVNWVRLPIHYSTRDLIEDVNMPDKK